MMQRLRCVGGPADGRVVSIDRDRSYFQAFHQQPTCPPYSPRMVNAMCETVEIVIYVRHWIMAPDGRGVRRETEYLAPIGWCPHSTVEHQFGV